MPSRPIAETAREKSEAGVVSADIRPAPEPVSSPPASVTPHTPPVTLSWLASKRSRVISAVIGRNRNHA